MLTPEEIEKRKMLWEAMSDLWIDTELFEYQLVYIAEIMRQSNYSLDELEKICFQEVAPVVYGNLLNVAGIWSGFDSQWLVSNILKNLQKQQRNLFYRWWVKSRSRKLVMTKLIQKDWKKVIEIYQACSPLSENNSGRKLRYYK